MAQIGWTEEARRWLEDIFEYIAADSPATAGRTVQGIYERAQVLASFPRSATGTFHPHAISESCSMATTGLPTS